MASKLGMMVAQLRREMGHGEFVLWSRWYARKHQAEQLEMMRNG